jgi:hypothetical protein
LYEVKNQPTPPQSGRGMAVLVRYLTQGTYPQYRRKRPGYVPFANNQNEHHCYFRDDCRNRFGFRRDVFTRVPIYTNNGTVLNKFEAIDYGVKTVSDQEENIRNAMEEQGEGSKQILDVLSRLSNITQMVKGGSMEMLEAVFLAAESLKRNYRF